MRRFNLGRWRCCQLFLDILLSRTYLRCEFVYRHSEFTPVKGLKYNRSTLGSSAQSGSSSGNHHHHHHQQQSSHIPIVHSSADLNSVGSSTANSSTSSLHAYSVSGGRPLRSGSMDDVRLAANGKSTLILCNLLTTLGGDIVVLEPVRSIFQFLRLDCYAASINNSSFNYYTSPFEMAVLNGRLKWPYLGQIGGWYYYQTAL